MNKIIYNPFEKIPEIKVLVLGVALTIGGSLLGYLFDMRFDGVINVHAFTDIPLSKPFIDNVINIAALCVTLYTLGRVVNNKTRFVDILNTALICRSPFYLLALGNANHFFTNLEAKTYTANPLSAGFTWLDILILSVFSIFTIAFLIWFAALVYNGFKTATNLKRTGHKIAFVFAVIVAEAIASTLIYYFN